MGFGVKYGEDGVKLNSSTFNINLCNHLDQSKDREAMEFFTPILQIILRKYKVEKCVGFTLNVEYIPLKIYDIYTALYLNKHLEYKVKCKYFDNEDKFYSWCREYYKDEYNRNQGFDSWFIKRDYSLKDGELNFFTKFRIVSKSDVIRISNRYYCSIS
jgi:hypothetical protein